MKEIIKRLIQSEEAPLVFGSNDFNTRQQLYLFQYMRISLLAGVPVPAGTYLLANEKLGKQLIDTKYVKRVSNDSINALVLPYLENNAGKIIVNDFRAEIIVTSRLTGCTIAAEINSQKPTLLHLNKVTGNGKIDQKEIDKEIQKEMGGKKLFILKKEDYKNIDLKENIYSATFFGIRDGASWSYYSQYLIYRTTDKNFFVVPGKCYLAHLKKESNNINLKEKLRIAKNVDRNKLIIHPKNSSNLIRLIYKNIQESQVWGLDNCVNCAIRIQKFLQTGIMSEKKIIDRFPNSNEVKMQYSAEFNDLMGCLYSFLEENQHVLVNGTLKSCGSEHLFNAIKINGTIKLIDTYQGFHINSWFEKAWNEPDEFLTLFKSFYFSKPKDSFIKIKYFNKTSCNDLLKAFKTEKSKKTLNLHTNISNNQEKTNHNYPMLKFFHHPKLNFSNKKHKNISLYRSITLHNAGNPSRNYLPINEKTTNKNTLPSL